MPTSPVSHVLGALTAALALGTVTGCRTTVDSLGFNAAGGADGSGGANGSGGSDGSGGAGGAVVPGLHPLTGPASYPNAFRDVLGKTEADISAKIAAAFAQLFHGDSTQAIYYPVGSDQAYILDVLHGDVRTEGVGFGMMIAVQLDKRDEFDRLWRYAKTQLTYATGPNRGYFRSSCDGATSASPCVDPFGHQQLVMALVFAKDRWAPPAPATLDYEADAIALIDVMRTKGSDPEAVAAGVTSMFDTATKLVVDLPDVTSATRTRPSILMPAYEQLLAQATGDSFWSDAAARARAFWKTAANPVTGFMPTRATFDGTPVPGSDTFQSQGFRTPLNIVLDRIWFGTEPWEVDEANRLLQFFASRGIATYGNSFSLDGATTLDPAHDVSLVVMNGATALIATNTQAAAFVNEVWNLPIPSGPARYYQGILDLLSLLALGGHFRVY